MWVQDMALAAMPLQKAPCPAPLSRLHTKLLHPLEARGGQGFPTSRMQLLDRQDFTGKR